MKLNVQNFGVACGIVWGSASLLLGLSVMLFGYGSELQELLGSIYVGYEPTIGGSILGGVWGLIDAYIGGIVFAWLYNKLGKK